MKSWAQNDRTPQRKILTILTIHTIHTIQKVFCVTKHHHCSSALELKKASTLRFRLANASSINTIPCSGVTHQSLIYHRMCTHGCPYPLPLEIHYPRNVPTTIGCPAVVILCLTTPVLSLGSATLPTDPIVPNECSDLNMNIEYILQHIPLNTEQ